MSRRRGGGPSRAAPPAGPRPGPPLVAAGLGLVLGAAGAPALLERLSGGARFEELEFAVITPHRVAALKDPLNARGMRVEGGALHMVPAAFEQADRLVLRDERAVGAVAVRLAPGSAPLNLLLMPPAGSMADPVPVVVHPDGFSGHPGTPLRPTGGGVRLWLDGERYLVETPEGPVEVARHGGGTLELSAVRQPGQAADEVDEVLLDEITVTAADGSSLAALRFEAAGPPLAARLAVAGIGALVGLCAGLLASGGLLGALGAVLGLALPALVLSLPYTTLLSVVERLVLVRTTARELLAVLLGLSLLPLLAGGLLATGLLAAPAAPDGAADRAPARAWVGLVVLCALLGARGLEGLAMLWALPGALLLLLPLRAAAASGAALWGALLRASPAPLLVAGLGWGAGLLPALLWQLLLLWAEAPRLAARAARPGADALLLSLLALPLGAEALLRQTYLDQAWSAERLSGVEAGANDEVDDFAPFWIGRCGADAGKLVVWWLGGSAAGGAYQEGATPEMYFPAQLHERLCAAGFALRTVNFANGGRDSHTFSRGVAKALQSDRPDVVFAYWGVNDLLTSSAGLTRKEREAAAATRGAVATGLLGVGRRARLLNGAALWARPVDKAEAPDRPAVPVDDAMENHARLLTALQGAGAELVLIPEQARPRPYAMLASYREAQQRFVAQQAKGVEWVDAGQLGFTRALQEPGAAERLLVDSNHLAPEGHAILAEVLEGPAKAALQRRREARDGAAP
ncbi:MAG: hypothetical protein JNM72_12285 [Deltaproteobacteria bacterium]|nr:hypothetical protein [Deltaproteobacteria bacterium]